MITNKNKCKKCGEILKEGTALNNPMIDSLEGGTIQQFNSNAVIPVLKCIKCGHSYEIVTINLDSQFDESRKRLHLDYNKLARIFNTSPIDKNQYLTPVITIPIADLKNILNSIKESLIVVWKFKNDKTDHSTLDDKSINIIRLRNLNQDL